MGFEEIDINGSDDIESIDDLASGLPKGWKKSEINLISYSKEYAHDLHAEITVVYNNEVGPYVVNQTIKDAETEKTLSENSYLADTKEAMEAFVNKMFKLYDKTFPEN